MKNFLRENAVVKSRLGLCAAVGVTTTFWGGFAMGITVTAILTVQMLVMSLVAKNISESGRVVVSLMLGAGLASLADVVMKSFFYDISMALGWYIPLIAVSGLIVVLAPSGADETAGRAAAKGFVAGLGYMLMLISVSLVRELLGFGSLFGIPLGLKPMSLMTTPFGGFIVLGLTAALVQWLGREKNVQEAGNGRQ
ncbi:MAG: Rnf-Nqr domain containing protein [Oscillospiraceae bacterium]